MGIKPSKAFELTHRQHTVAGMYLEKKTQMEIAGELGISQGTVSKDLIAVQEMWRASAIRNMDLLKQKTLAEIDNLERKYQEAWERSKLAKKTVSKKDISGAKGATFEERETVEDRVGDPRYLDGILKCIARRCQILGLDNDVHTIRHETEMDKVINLIQSGKIVYEKLAKDIGEDMAAEFFAKAGVRAQHGTSGLPESE